MSTKFTDLLEKLVSVSQGNLIAVASLADDVAGHHIKKHFEDSQSKFDTALTEDTRDAMLEMWQQVQYNSTSFRIVREIVELLHGDLVAVQKIAAKWDTIPQQSPPDLRDLVVGASRIAPVFASSTGPLRRMYIEALRGSYTPEVFTFARGPELLDALINSAILPEDLNILAAVVPNTFVSLQDFRSGVERPEVAQRLEAYERLAAGGFIDMVTQDGSRLFITHRTEATLAQLRISMRPRGRLLLVMMAAGRG